MSSDPHEDPASNVPTWQGQSVLSTDYDSLTTIGPPNIPSDAVSLGGEKIPTDLEFLCASFSVLFEKKSDEKEQFLSGLRSKVKFLSGQVKWTLRALFWVFFFKTPPMASFDVCAHLSSGD